MASFPRGVWNVLEQRSSNIDLFIYFIHSFPAVHLSLMLGLKLRCQHLSSITTKDKKRRAYSIQDQCCIVSTLEYQTLFLCKPTERSFLWCRDEKLYEICQLSKHVEKYTWFVCGCRNASLWVMEDAARLRRAGMSRRSHQRNSTWKAVPVTTVTSSYSWGRKPPEDALKLWNLTHKKLHDAGEDTQTKPWHVATKQTTEAINNARIKQWEAPGDAALTEKY